MDGNLLTFLQHNRCPKYTSFLNKLKKDIYTPVGKLKAKVYKSKEPIAFSDVESLDFSDIDINTPWGGFFDCAWFKFDADLDFDNFDDKVVILDVSGEGCIYNENGAIQGITSVIGMVDNFQTIKGKGVVPLKRIANEGDKHLSFYLDCGNNGKDGKSNGESKFKRADICTFRKDIFDLYYDVLACYELISAIDDKEKIATTKKAINASIKAYKDNSPQSVVNARKELSVMFDGKDKEDFKVYAVGHGHLDLAWLWPVRETKRKAIRTFSNAVYQGENCDEYVFNGSQPQQYQWIKENAPKFYEKVKEAQKNGTIEAQGGMWVEPDTNLPCGESLIRQCYYGKNFFRKEFDKDVRTLWLPDVFGYTAALPQIIKKSGMDNFMTIKLSWNNINKFPHHTFKWTGLDDSEVLVHMPPEGDYNSNATPYAFEKTYKNYKEKEVSDMALMSFGIGDGGAGPGEYHINMAKRCEKLRYIPEVEMTSSEKFFDELKKNEEKYPEYKGELYLEKHQGTYTTQGLVKKNNRLTEEMLHFAEWISSLAYIKGKEYPNDKLTKIWQETLLYQFHDILPGSSITRVYDECNARYKVLQKELGQIIDDAVEYLSDKNSDSSSVYALNPTDFERNGYLKHNEKWYKYDVKPYSSCELVEADNQTNLKFEENVIENEFLKVTFNNKGQISEILDKVNNYNCVKEPFNAVRIYKDRFVHPYNAWDIDIKYTKQTPKDLKLVNSKTYLDGKCVVRENEFVYNNSKVTQKITLNEDSKFIKVDNHVDWHETHKMLRIDAYPKNFGDKVLCDIQFGNIERTTKTESSVDYAQFEIPAHKWVDVYDDGYGVAILNDCKYGHRVKDGLISLNCLRSPVYPDKTADRGEHDFAYAIYPHKEKAMDSELVKIGYELNNPIKVVNNKLDVENLLVCDSKDIIVETVMINDNGNLVFRVYENSGKATSTSLKLNIDAKSVTETNMLFEDAKEIDLNNMVFKPFEIKTIEVIR